MENEPELRFEDILHKREGGMGRTHYNSRHSMSFDADLISINQDTFELQQQFEEIDYAIRLQTPTITPQQRRESVKNIRQQPALLSDVIEIELEQSKQITIPVSQEAGIPQIRLSNAHQPEGNGQMVTVMVILTSQKELSNVRVTLDGCQQNQEISSYQEKYQYRSTFVAICIFCASFQEFKDLKIKYKEVSRTMLVFSSKMDKEISLIQTKIHENVGLLFNALQEEVPNAELINFCILAAQEHISKRVRELIAINPITIAHFHHFLLHHYHPYHSNIAQLYAAFPSSNTKTNHYAIEFFLYFLFQNYREDAINKLQEFKLLPRLAILRGCSKVLSSKFYQLFDNGQCFKDFLLYAYFLIAINNEPKNIELIRSIVKYNILHQNELQVLRILLRLESLREGVMTVIGMRKVCSRLISNKEVSFECFMMLRLKALRQMILEENGDQQCDYKAISSWILEFITDLMDKVRFNPPQKDDNPTKYRQFIQEVFLYQGRLRVTNKDFAILYAKLKFMYRIARGVWHVVMQALKGSLMAVLPQMLLTHYESIIHSLILKPQVAQENKILVDFFQNQPVSTQQVVFLTKIWMEGKSELYNYVTIEFVLLKFIALNPHVPKIDLQELMRVVDQFTNGEVLPYHRRKEISLFFLKLRKEMGDHQHLMSFSLWQRGLFNGQF